MASNFSTPGVTLLAAQERALAADHLFERLALNPITRGIPSLDVHERIVTAQSTLTLEGASTIEIGIHDLDWLIERSGILDPDENGHLNAVDITVDGVLYRLVKAGRTDPATMTLTFEDIVWSRLDDHRKRRSWSRGSVTRAQAIEAMVREVGAPYYSPDKGIKQPTKALDYPDATPTRGESGFDKGASFKIKGVSADAEQKRNAATALTVADQLDAGPLATLALIVAGIGESLFRVGAADFATGSHVGVFQSNQIPARDVESQARHFLLGGKGFGEGGAIAAARANPTWSPGTIATKVEISGEPGSFYDAHRAEAKAIIAAWNSGSSSGTDTVLRTKEYRFTRGLPDQVESSIDAAMRLAQEVQWRFFVAGNVASFISDDFLLMNPAGVVLRWDDDGILERPTYDQDRGKLTGEIAFRVVANRWAVTPGDVWALIGSEWGSVVGGRYIVKTVEENFLDATDMTVTLTVPLPPRKEPAADLIESTVSKKASGGAAQALAWAKAKIGHYKEEFGANRGTELDRLERRFDMVGQPWCAIFATTAVGKVVGPQAQTAAVAQIRQWAQEGSHGYQRGFRGTPKPGDLLCIGTSHVALIEKVNGKSVGTIEGNTSANKVARLTRLASDGDIVRPDYLNE